MTEPTTRCVICTGERTAHVGLLCNGHFDRMAQMLRDVEDQAAMLDARPSMAIRNDAGKGSLASERAPARLDVLAFRDPQTRRWIRDEVARHPLPAPKAFGPWCLFCDHETCTDWRAGRRRDLHDDEHDAGSERLMSILGVLNGWARVVREERGLSDPTHCTVTTERDTLTRQLGWLANQPFIDEMFGELRQLLLSLRDLNGTSAERPVGRCYLPAEDGLCEGPIWVDNVAGQAHCGRCRSTWDGPRLASLKFEMERAKREAKAEADRPKMSDGRRMLTVKELSDRHKVSVNAIRIRLSRIGAKAVQGHYDPDVLTERSKASA